MSDPRVEGIRAQLKRSEVWSVNEHNLDYLLTKLDEATAALERARSYSDALGLTIAAEERERILLAGVREALTLHQGVPWHEPSDNTRGVACPVCDSQQHPCTTFAVLSRLLSSLVPRQKREELQ